jgi:hypothetical protein
MHPYVLLEQEPEPGKVVEVVDIVPEPEPEPIKAAWYNDLSHDITDSTVFRWILIIVVFDYIWRRLSD